MTVNGKSAVESKETMGSQLPSTAVEEKNSGQFLGRVGCLEPEGWPAFEVGYSLSRAAWATDSRARPRRSRCIMRAKVLGRAEIVSFIRPLNAASVRVAVSLGAAEAETIESFDA